MKWTDKIPTKPGWYFFKFSDRVKVYYVSFASDDRLMVNFGTIWQSFDFLLERLHCQIAGPIPEPEE